MEMNDKIKVFPVDDEKVFARVLVAGLHTRGVAAGVLTGILPGE